MSASAAITALRCVCARMSAVAAITASLLYFA
jgi:hypothetical protein